MKHIASFSKKKKGKNRPTNQSRQRIITFALAHKAFRVTKIASINILSYFPRDVLESLLPKLNKNIFWWCLQGDICFYSLPRMFTESKQQHKFDSIMHVQIVKKKEGEKEIIKQNRNSAHLSVATWIFVETVERFFSLICAEQKEKYRGRRTVFFLLLFFIATQ